MAEGLWNYAKLTSHLRVYVRPDGTWFVTQYIPKFDLVHKFIQSDHNSRGTNLEFGKQASEAYLRDRLYF